MEIYRKRRPCALLLAFLLLLSGGCSAGNGETYVDLESEQSQEAVSGLNLETGDFAYDDKAGSISLYTIGEGFLYSFGTPRRKIDLRSGKAQYFCTIPGCAHTMNDLGCLTWRRDMYAPEAAEEGVYYIQGSRVMLFHDGAADAVLENEYYTDYEEEVYAESKTGLSFLAIRGDLLYVFGPTWFCTYNRKTQEKTQPEQLFCDSLILSAVVWDDSICFATESMELYRYDRRNKVSEKLTDKAAGLSETDGSLYYIRWEGETPVLYGFSEAEGAQRLVENCSVSYCVKKGYLYYQSTDNSLYVSRLDGSDKKKIELTCQEKPLEGSVNIISSGFMDYVFVIGGTDDRPDECVFIFEAGSAEYLTADFGEE